MELPLRQLCFYEEPSAFPGVHRVAGKVRRDAERVFGVLPDSVSDSVTLGDYALIYGTIGHSPLLDALHAEKRIDLSPVRGKREVFLFTLVQNPLPGVKTALVVAGSDKRGTIYGLFHLSERMGVSPLVDWSEVCPAPRDNQILDQSCRHISREPSVKFRGIFINDEWPAFGNWCNQNFGGFNAEMYDHVFELILRHKGNFFWPAMWSSSFSCDGPGMASARLADEYGIVIGTSHHEPCIRHGEEYSHVRGPDSPYGDAWNFRSNREGIIRFWEDGLKRSGALENVITVGMRGERDTAILGREATLEENIRLLREVVNIQNDLMTRHVNPKLEEIPRCLVMFTEVERFYHGTADTKGLADDPCLDGVTLMVCDDNFGNIKSMPDEKMRAHKGGLGLYYHFDFHGGPTSHEWTNTSYLPKIWEQLSLAYEHNVRDIWVVNVGDIGLQEYPIAYYFAMAYDMDAWGASAPNRTEDFTRSWLRTQFGDAFSPADQNVLRMVLDGYTRLHHNRKPEVMRPEVYHPVHYGEAEDVLAWADYIISSCNHLREKCPRPLLPAFIELIYYPAVSGTNVQRMQILAGRNHFFARQNRLETNDLADAVAECIRFDRELAGELHSINGGKWYAFGTSEHIGFTHWIDENNLYPQMIRIEPANKHRLIVAHSESSEYTTGYAWTGKPLVFDDFLRPDVNALRLDLACGSRMAVDYEITSDCPWLHFSATAGCTVKTDRIVVTIDRQKLSGKATGEARIRTVNADIKLLFHAENPDLSSLTPLTFLERSGYICMEAEHCAAKNTAAPGSSEFIRIAPYGRTLSAMIPTPLFSDLTTPENQPWLEYRFIAEQDGDYQATLYLSPSNPLYVDSSIDVGISINGGDIRRENTTGADFVAHSFQSQPWMEAVTDNIRTHSLTIPIQKGENTLRIYALTPAVALERILLHPANAPVPKSYLGPTESYYTPLINPS